MVREDIRVNLLRERFDYRDGTLYWKDGKREGKKAGWVNPDNSYIHINFKFDGEYRRMLAHRIIFAMHHGWLPFLVDHINQNPEDNRIENLRAADKSLNALNTIPRKNNKTGHKGVFLDKGGKFQASVWDKGKKIYLGRFEECEYAVMAIKKWREENDVRRDEDLAKRGAGQDI